MEISGSFFAKTSFLDEPVDFVGGVSGNLGSFAAGGADTGFVDSGDSSFAGVSSGKAWLLDLDTCLGGFSSTEICLGCLVTIGGPKIKSNI